MRAKIILILILFLAAILRIYYLNKIPNSLYTDEVSQGYNAFSILKTGRDEHGSFLPVSLRSFGDWKPPLPTYIMIPFVFVLGLDENAVRLPSAILGILSLVLAYQLVLSLFPGRNYKLALFTSFFLAISPWHILQSRSAMLVMIAFFFYISAVYYFQKGLHKNSFFILSFLSFSLSIYSYYGLRIIAPFTIIFLLLFYRKNINFLSRGFVFGVIAGLVILLPLAINLLQKPDVVLGRAKTVSIFYDQGIKLRKWELITKDGLANPLLTQFFHNNYFLYTRDIVRRFLSHFDGKYLFLQGDTVDPFRIPSMGIFYLIDSLFLILGAYKLYESKSQSKYILLFWLIIAVVPSALTFITPASNRSFNVIFPLILFIALGMTSVSKRIILSCAVSFIYIISLVYFLNQFFINMPLNHADWWRYQLKETAKYAISHEKKYQNVVFLSNYEMTYVYILFYSRYNPERFQNEAVRTHVADPFGFEHVESFSKYIFYNDLNWKDIKDNRLPNSLYVVPLSQSGEETDYTKLINYPDGKAAFKIFL